MTSLTDYDAILVRQEGRLVTVTLNRPERLNASTPEVREQLVRFWFEVAGDDSVGAIVLTGAGRAFCAGADLKSMKGNVEEQSDEDYLRRRAVSSDVTSRRIMSLMLDVEQPIIGAINGDAIGLGASLAFACDIIVANENARFADTHVKNLGVAAGDGGTVLWPSMMGIHKAKEFILTGDFLVAKDAAAMGYINYAVPQEEVLPKAYELANKLANGPQWAIRWTKSAINKILREQLNLTLDTAQFAEKLCFASSDHREAVSAFVEKRPPVYTGH